MIETLQDFLTDLGLDSHYENNVLQSLIEGDSKYIRDIRMNFKGFLKSKDLNEKEVYL
jgi:alkyl hydroperoxide reductase subunit D